MNYTPPEPTHIGITEVDWNDFEPAYGYTEQQLRSEVEKARREAIDECAKVCEDGAWRLKDLAISTKSEATNSRAIQASLCADAIRELLK